MAKEGSGAALVLTSAKAEVLTVLLDGAAKTGSFAVKATLMTFESRVVAPQAT